MSGSASGNTALVRDLVVQDCAGHDNHLWFGTAWDNL
jgi:hypothetical protein